MENSTEFSVTLVANGKGGTGKSMTASAYIDYLLHAKKLQNIFVIDADDSNPDVFKAHEKIKEISATTLNLDSENGWILLLNMLPKFAEIGANVVINTAARATPALMKNLPLLLDASKELNGKVQMLWTINRQRDSLILLNKLLGAVPEISTTVVRNLYYGDKEKFVLLETFLEKNKLLVIDLPDLNDAVADEIYNKRLPLCATENLKFGEKFALNNFRNEASKQFNLMK